MAMKKREKRELMRAIEQLYERAYRRGFVHGVYARDEEPRLDVPKVHRWRASFVGRKTKAPPVKFGCGFECSIRDRMEAECQSSRERRALRWLYNGEES